MATTYTVTNDFSADTTAVADEVDANFTDVLNALNSFDASNLGSGTVPLARISGLTTSEIAAATLVTEGEGINSNDNDTTIPTSAAVNDHLESHIGTGTFSPAAYAGEESVTFPNGLIIKMGKTNYAAGWSSRTITFGTAFPTDIICAICNGSASTATDRNSHSDTHTLTTSSFQTYGNGGDISWFAVGY